MRTVAVFAGTKNLYRYMYVAVKSLLLNTRMDAVYLLTEDDVFPYDLPSCVQNINISGQTYFHPGGPNFSTCWTYMALIKTALTKILPDEDRVLWLDSDIIVDGNIADLFEMDMDGYCYAGVREPLKCSDVFTYVNAGVLLCNLDLIRKLGRDDEMIDYLNRYQRGWPDQETINMFCQGRIRTIGSEYNRNNWTEQCFMPKIMHYAGMADWDDEYLYKKYANRSLISC